MEVQGGVHATFWFAFDNPRFSDRILRIELIGDSLHEHSNASSSSGSVEPRSVKTVHISSLVLAIQSPFFRELFTNGMGESALSVHASEELAMLDLLQFMYGDTLKANTSADLLKVLVLADRFQVIKCAAHCAQRLSGLSMTFELAASCINLPSSVLEGGNSPLKSLVDQATCYLSKNFGSHYEAALNLPLESIERLLSWDTLEVGCEDEVYDFLLNWARAHYEDIGERCRVFSSRLCPLIRLPHMSCEKLKSMLQCEELELCVANKMVAEALLSKFGDHLSHEAASQGLGRTYRLKSIQVIVLHDSPYHECIVYSKLTKDDCRTIGKGYVEICTQTFHAGNESFYLTFKRLPEDVSPDKGFAITLTRSSKKSTIDALKLNLEFAVRSRTSGKFVERTSSFTLMREQGHLFIIGGSWDSIMKDDSAYFDNGILCIRITLSLRQ